MTNLIAFTGKMGVGKSTAIQCLRNHSSQKVALVKFAGPLYDIQNFIYEVISPVYSKPDNFIKDRKLLQWIGTDWGRETISQNLWVDLWKATVVEFMRAGDLPVCDDVRFDNEAQVVKGLGGTIVQIVSGKSEERIDTQAGIRGHASEQGVSAGLIDHTIYNNGSIQDFESSLVKLYEMLNVNGDLT